MALPGSLAAPWFLPYVGPKNACLAGFVCMASLYLVIVIFYDVLPSWLFIILYGLQLTSDEIGPSTATFVIPGEIFPTSIRATAHGISAACGKLGAVVGIYGVGFLTDTVGVRWMLLVITGLTAMAILWTYFWIPHYNCRTLKHLEEAMLGDARDLAAWLYGGGARGESLHFLETPGLIRSGGISMS